MGSNFIISLPVSVSKEQMAAKNEGTEMKWIEEKNKWLGKRCLYVEDQEQNQAIISKFLQHLGINVKFAMNGQEGLDMILANHHNLDLVLTDLRMPIMSGKEMIAEIRQHEKGNDLPCIKIIVITGEPTENERNMCIYTFAANDFLIKPISFDQLSNSIGNVFLQSPNPSCDSKALRECSRKLILIVDDDPYSSFITKQCLEVLNYPILQSYSIKEVRYIQVLYLLFRL